MGSTPSIQSFYHPTFSLAIFSFLLTILFLLTISRPPPGGYFKTKKLLHTFAHRSWPATQRTHPKYVNAQVFLQCEDALSVIPAILLVWVVWVSSRRSSRTGPLTLHSCTWLSRFVDQPCAAFPAPSGTFSSPSRH